ncbi:MAG: hypothetical protein GXO64_04245 [Candidatus Micrarchaeota archaeon]|nr:hypothetical protein [Candidatus Micrarchaeota archaeon]
MMESGAPKKSSKFTIDKRLSTSISPDEGTFYNSKTVTLTRSSSEGKTYYAIISSGDCPSVGDEKYIKHESSSKSTPVTLNGVNGQIKEYYICYYSKRGNVMESGAPKKSSKFTIR